jgi:3-hydroxyisobutyrate dehydrogenase-like beta-hydroxyacid dehydrogenase
MKLLARDEVKLGFIGLGNMGSRIARRLLNDAYHLIVYDPDRTRGPVMTADGAVVAGSIADLSQSADVILSCLTNDEAVQNVYYGDAGVLANARPGTLAFEMNTLFPKLSRELSQRGADHGIQVLDVAISGSTPAAEQGTIILLVGGDAGCFQRAQPLFRAISARSFHLGPPGAGTTMKLLVNALPGAGMEGVAEAISLAESAGIERNRLLQVRPVQIKFFGRIDAAPIT